MQIRVEQISLTDIKADAVIVNLFEGVTSPGGGTGAVDRALGGQISALIASGEIKGKLNEMTLIHSGGRVGADRVLVAGLGKGPEFDPDKIRQVTGTALRFLRKRGVRRVATILHGAGIGAMDPIECARALAEGALQGLYRSDIHKTKREENASEIDKLIVAEMSADKIDQIAKGLREGEIIGQAASFARNLVNEPGNVINPETLANIAVESGREKGFQVEVLETPALEAMGARGLLAAGMGSAVAPRMIVMRSMRGGCGETIALIGKGVTFDTGGISIKPSDKMHIMKTDMAGAAAVIGAMRAVSELELPVNVIGIIPAFENMPSGNAYRPGDVIEMMGGKTVEIITTDAEGRMGLADCITYAKQLGAAKLIDIATLTGGCIVALGNEVSGLLGSDQDLVDQIKAAGERAGELFWQLPMFAHYAEQNKGDVADLKNSAGREGQTITASAFLKEFAEDTPWAHLDIAGPSFTEKETPWRDKGATGVGVRTFLYLLKH